MGPGVPGWRGPPARSRGCKQRLRTPTGHRTSQSHSTGQWGTGRGEQATWANMQASWEARAGPTDPLRDGVVWSHPCCAGQSVAPSSPCTAIGSIRGGRRRRHTHSTQAAGAVASVAPSLSPPCPGPLPLGASAVAAFRGAPNNAAIPGGLVQWGERPRAPGRQGLGRRSHRFLRLGVDPRKAHAWVWLAYHDGIKPQGLLCWWVVALLHPSIHPPPPGCVARLIHGVWRWAGTRRQCSRSPTLVGEKGNEQIAEPSLRPCRVLHTSSSWLQAAAAVAL